MHGLHGMILSILLLPVHHLVVLLLVDLGVVGCIAGSQQPRLFLKLVVLLDLSAAWQTPRSDAVKATAAADSKLLSDLFALHPKG